MKNKVNKVIISYWYKELMTNPIGKIEELENSLNKMFNRPFMVNNMEVGYNLSIPRIQALNSDKTMLFTMSLVNANLSVHYNEEVSYDDIILMINENTQLFYDLLKEIYDVEIVYTSIKMELMKEDENPCLYLKDKLNLEDMEYEDLSFKKVICKDDTYYINYMFNTGKEINFNIGVKGSQKPSQNDMFDRSMLISLSDADVTKRTFNTVVEVNDRLAFNSDGTYLTTKENIRGMISEVKDILNKRVDDLL